MSSSPAPQGLLAADDLTGLRERWMRLEEWFVDDPTAAVRGADELIDDVVDRIRAALTDHRSSVRAHWDASDDATTEQLRRALHAYEQLFRDLTDLPAPAGWHEDRSPDMTEQAHIEKGTRP
ncbi:MAG TPA: hypothetical protein VK875_08545 [Euzebyales bacterium]|nr:hypothetical protein [Euzebyales bacterium]